MSLIPFLMLTSLNFSLFRTIQRSGLSPGARKRRDQGIAAMLILVVLVFGLCNVIRIVINVYEVRGRHYNPHGEQHLLQVALVIQGLGDGDWPNWCSQLSHVSNILLVLNSSVNIVIYCWSGKQFKAVLVSIVTKNEVDYQVCNSVCICIKLSQYHCHYNVYIWKKKKNF